MQRLRMHAAGPEDRTARQAVLLSTAAGALQVVAPLALPAAAQLEVPAALEALRALQRELALLLPQAAGLNPAAFRCAVGGWGLCSQCGALVGSRPVTHVRVSTAPWILVTSPHWL